MKNNEEKINASIYVEEHQFLGENPTIILPGTEYCFSSKSDLLEALHFLNKRLKKGKYSVYFKSFSKLEECIDAINAITPSSDIVPHQQRRTKNEKEKEKNKE